MSVAAPWGGLACILIIAWSAQLSVSESKCGFCKNTHPCDKDRGWCPGGCKAGWYGHGCLQSCKESKCLGVCNCSRVCEQCDTQAIKCRKDKCMEFAAIAGTKPNGLQYDSTLILAVITGGAFAVGIAIAVVFATWRRSSSTELSEGHGRTHAPARGLRGVVLGHACCAKCPAFRDCLQWLGTALHLPGFGLGARDSLDTFCEEDEIEGLTYSQHMHQSRHERQHGVVGVKTDAAPIRFSGTSGYKWKKKWRDRREKSKQKRKLKHQERKRMRDDDPSAAARARAGSIVLPAIGAGLMGFGHSLQAGARRGSAYASTLFSKRGSVGQNPSATVVGRHLSPALSPSSSNSSLQRPGLGRSPSGSVSGRLPPVRQPNPIREEDDSEANLGGGGEDKGSSNSSSPSVLVSPPNANLPMLVVSSPPAGSHPPPAASLSSRVVTPPTPIAGSDVSVGEFSSPADPVEVPNAVRSSPSLTQNVIHLPWSQ